MKIPRPLINDPGLVSLKSAARAAIVMPAVFAFADQVIGQPQTALFAAFGSFAMLVLASFSGPPRSRFTAYLSLGISGVALVALGTACSGNAWLAAGAMAVVGFVILFSGVINGYFAAGGTAAVLVFVLSVSVPAPVSAIGPRLAGWGLAAGVGLLAVMLIWPPRERATLRADAAGGCRTLAGLADALCDDRAVEAARLDAARDSMNGLRGRLTTTPHRPTGPTRPMAALSGLIDELTWLFQSLEMMASAPAGDLCVAENSAAIRAVAVVLRASAGELDGRPELSDRDQTGKQPVQRLEHAREHAAQLLARRVAEQPRMPDQEALQAQVDRGFRVYTISYTTRQIAAYARAASPHPGGPPIEALPDLADLAATARAAAADPGADALTGEVLTSHRWNGWISSRLAGAHGFTVAHADYRSVWFRNSVRGAVGLAIAVFIAQRSGLQHSFWVVLGTLSVLRSNALGTGRSVISALAGTAVGIVVGAAILIPLKGDETVLWAILPVAVLLGAYAPRVISFAAGQAAFTVVVLVLFNIIQPTGWKVGILRIEDVAVGFAISLGVGLVFWPRGAAALLRQNLAAAYSRTADYVAAMVEQLSGLDGGANPSRSELAAITAIDRLDDSYRQYLAERSAQRVDPERVSRMVGGVAKVLRAGESLAALNALADRPPVLGQNGPGPAGPGQNGPGPNGPGPGQSPGQDGTAPRTQLPVSPAGAPENGSRKPCAENLEQNVLALRAWYVTLGDSLVNGTAVPPPEERDPAARKRLLHCTREAISHGQPVESRNALLVLWASEHLDMLWRLEGRLGRTQDSGPAADARPVEVPAAAPAE